MRYDQVVHTPISSTSFERESELTRDNVPTTRVALFLPNADTADSRCSTAEAAISVIEMDDVSVAQDSVGASESSRLPVPRRGYALLDLEILQDSDSLRANVEVERTEIKQSKSACRRTSMTISTFRRPRTPMAGSMTETRSRTCPASASWILPFPGVLG